MNCPLSNTGLTKADSGLASLAAFGGFSVLFSMAYGSRDFGMAGAPNPAEIS